MGEELKPCPFCGGEAEADHRRGYISIPSGNTDHGAAIYCLGCNADMMICRGDHPELSDEDRMAIMVENWNRRTLPGTHVAIDAWRDKWHPQYASLAHAISAASQDLIVSADLVRNKTVGKRLAAHADLLGYIAYDLARYGAYPAPQTHVEGDTTAKLEADRNLYKGKYRSIIALMDDTRQKVQEIVDHIEDEGDRSYFGSSNHADWLRDLADDMTGWSFDAMLPKGDINKMERDPYADCRQLRWALKLSIEHIEHMAAFIGSLKAGYSFESLGEDMPEIKAALSPAKSEQKS